MRSAKLLVIPIALSSVVVSLVFSSTIMTFADAQAATVTMECPAGQGSCEPNNSNEDNLFRWFDEMGDRTRKFLESNVFGQQDLASSASDGEESKKAPSNFLEHLFSSSSGEGSKTEAEANENPYIPLFNRLTQVGEAIMGDASTKNPLSKDELAKTLVQRAQSLIANANENDQKLNMMEFVNLLKENFDKVMVQLEATFGTLLKDQTIDAGLLAVAMIYYVGHEDATKTPTWKRRQHRFYESVNQQFVTELHDALYLSQLAYVDTIDQIRTGLQSFQQDAWELLYATTESLPDLPAHFLMIHKQLAPLDKNNIDILPILPWERDRQSNQVVTVTLSVRGTKHLTDALADGLLEPADYRGGKAHGGILAAGKKLVEKHLPILKEILKHSGREKIKLFIVGHSLGAGAGSIAAMEFQEYDFIDVEAVGFGCPSLLSRELSESTKDYITTIVSDADVIPRMSGSSMVNLLAKLLGFDWTSEVLEDAEFSLERAQMTTPFGSMLPDKQKLQEFLTDFLEKQVRTRLRDTGKADPAESVLIRKYDILCGCQN